MELEALLKEEIKSALEKLDDEDKERGLSSYLPQLTFYKIHGLTNKENFHSKFITFLLNPKKQHGCGNNFLKLFIEILNKRIHCENLNLSSLVLDDYNEAKAETGTVINKKQISGGRVDIRIFKTKEVKKKNIIIENKIYAQDQWAQLARYNTDYSDSTIVYLTLLGKSASSYSLNYQNKKLEKEDYIRISYKDDIKRWLCQCLNYLQNDDNYKNNKEQNNKVSILINDYLTVIKELTYGERKKEVILSILSKNIDTVKFVFENPGVVNKITEYKDTIIPLKRYLVREKFIKIMLNNLIETIGDGLSWKINEGRGIMQKGWGFQFYKTKWEKINIKIGFYFKKKNLEDCNFGLQKYNPAVDTTPECFTHQIKDKKSKSGWYCLEKLSDYPNWYRNIFYDLMSVNIEKTPFYECIEGIVRKKCDEIESIILK